MPTGDHQLALPRGDAVDGGRAIGTYTVMAPEADWSNSSPVPWPSCQIHTMMPYTAASETSLSSSALNGSTVDRSCPYREDPERPRPCRGAGCTTASSFSATRRRLAIAYSKARPSSLSRAWRPCCHSRSNFSAGIGSIDGSPSAVATGKGASGTMPYRCS